VEQAKQAGSEIAAGRYRGPLHGVPIGLKDLIYTKGIRTTMGSGVYKDFIPDVDAAVVQKLKQAGAVIIGKLNTHEFAYGSTGDVSYFGGVRNPYDTSKMTGGSSSGSGAAVAAALCFGALGTDTGGSIRIPASACGIVGMKPTFGRVSKNGVYPLAHTLDHVGPMTRTVRDNAMLLGILAGYDHGDPYSVQQAGEDFTRFLGDSIRGKVIGIPSSFYFDHVEEEVKRKIEEAIDLYRSMGAEVRTVDIAGLSEISWSQLKTIQSEAYAVHQELLVSNADKYHPEVLERFQVSAEAKGYEYVKAQDIRRRVQESFRRVFESIDVLVTPTIPILPPDIGQREIDIKGQSEPVRAALLRLTGPTNVTGLPSMSIPCGFSKTGLPIGLQLIGGAFNEALLYQFGAAFEKEASISTLKWGNK
jgi:aspartyl-tRNA(Asn)/glutamyl-tRNA(Gln) amidotransferase subunit A